MIYFYLLLLSLHLTFVITTIVGLCKDDVFLMIGIAALFINIFGGAMALHGIILAL